jgi:hypothetical protein
MLHEDRGLIVRRKADVSPSKVATWVDRSPAHACTGHMFVGSTGGVPWKQSIRRSLFEPCVRSRSVARRSSLLPAAGTIRPQDRRYFRDRHQPTAIAASPSASLVQSACIVITQPPPAARATHSVRAERFPKRARRSAAEPAAATGDFIATRAWHTWQAWMTPRIAAVTPARLVPTRIEGSALHRQVRHHVRGERGARFVAHVDRLARGKVE